MYNVHKPGMVDLPVLLTICLRPAVTQCVRITNPNVLRRPLVQPEIHMTTFDERKNAFEKKFAMDQDLKFRAESRRNKMVAEWAAAKLGISGPALEDYIKAVRKADLQEKGDDDVFRKIREDFDAKGVSASDVEIRDAMFKSLEDAVAQIEKETK
jgi:hypothetical protein